MTIKKYVLPCKNCGEIRAFSSPQSFSAGKKKLKCNKCKDSYKDKWKRDLSDEELKVKTLELSEKISKQTSGKNNPMYGRSLNSVWIEKYGEDAANLLTEKHRQKASDNNARGMSGKNVLQVWTEKYGETKAAILDKERRRKLSIKSTGKNNPMYGKPAPQGSGNGWSGWYNGWYFRSLMELSYMINIIESKNQKWMSAETSKYRIPYISWDGNERTYTADFIIGDEMIEIKPKSLHESKEVKRKEEAGRKFCAKHKMKYILTDCDIDKKQITKLYLEDKIKFIKRYEEKMQTLIKNNK